MLQSPEPKYTPAATPATNYTPVKPATSPMDQAHIGRSLVIKGEVSGAESLFVDGRIEGTISFPENRVTIGRNGNVAASIVAKEVVIMGKVQGNVECSDRLDIRSEGQLSGDVITLVAALLFGIYIVYIDVYTKEDDFVQLGFVQLAVTAVIAWLLVPWEQTKFIPS